MIDLVMVFHCHQPVGNFHSVFKSAVEKCYRPLLEQLKSNPPVRVGLHFSGPLLEWLDLHDPGTIDLMASLAGRGQVEMLSGGFFEPLLPVIPEEDARGQVKMMNEWLRERFGRRPEGLWLTERVWDAALPGVLDGTGLKYTIVDDTHFQYAGVDPDDIYGSYLTERHGSVLRLMATPKDMRYLIPFKPVEDVIGHLRKLEAAGREVVVYGDDGEKFGMWPGTYEWVMEKGWLDKFFKALAENRDWLRTVPPGEYVKSSRPMGRLYLPPASYEEMTEWALPSSGAVALRELVETMKREGRWDEWGRYIRGGLWDNFLVKYEESNRMHKKMLWLSARARDNGDARRLVWRGQCNCAYWHGVFGGLYLGHLRRGVHGALAAAHARIVESGGGGIFFERFDYDKDGEEEVLVSSPGLCLGFAPHRGGCIFDITHSARALNLTDTLTRREEAYHRDLLEAPAAGRSAPRGEALSIHEITLDGAEELRDSLVIDRYPRACSLDHFMPLETGFPDYSSGVYREIGDFVTGAFHLEQASVADETVVLKTRREGRVGDGSVFVEKSIVSGTGTELDLEMSFRSANDSTLSCLYGCEFNLTLFSDKDPSRYYRVPEPGSRRQAGETGEEKDVRRFDLVNESEDVTMSFFFSKPVGVWFYPLMTVARSEEGFERTYQGSSLLFVMPLRLAPGSGTGLHIRMSVT